MNLMKGKRAISKINVTCTPFYSLQFFLTMILFFLLTSYENYVESSTRSCCIKEIALSCCLQFLACIFVGGLACKLGLLECNDLKIFYQLLSWKLTVCFSLFKLDAVQLRRLSNYRGRILEVCIGEKVLLSKWKVFPLDCFY